MRKSSNVVSTSEEMVSSSSAEQQHAVGGEVSHVGAARRPDGNGAWSGAASP